MKSRAGSILAAIVIAGGALGVGVMAGSAALIGVRIPTSIGAGMVGERVVTLFLDDTAFGARTSVAWREANGTEHDSGWPDCLVPGEVSGVRFQGAVVWHDGVGDARILWIDCGSVDVGRDPRAGDSTSSAG